MKLHITQEWLDKKIKEEEEAGIEEPGILACSPEIYKEMRHGWERFLRERAEEEADKLPPV